MSETSNFFENIIIKNDIIHNIISFMRVDSIKNMVISSKVIYKSRDVKYIIKKRLLKHEYIINKYIKKYYRIIKKIKSIEMGNIYFPNYRYKIFNSFYFYRYYPKIHIKGFFECVKLKLNIDEIFFKDNNLLYKDPKRNDLFNLIRLLSETEIEYVGW